MMNISPTHDIRVTRQGDGDYLVSLTIDGVVARSIPFTRKADLPEVLSCLTVGLPDMDYEVKYDNSMV